MSNNKINYAIVALTTTKVDEVIDKLKEEGNETLSKWLDENKNFIYGNLPEDWKPFCDGKIKNIINENSNYLSNTPLIEEYFEGRIQFNSLKKIQIYFIDLFTMYIEKYNALAKLCDASFCDAKNNNCCFLINNAFPYHIQEQLEKNYNDVWKSVADEYLNGSLHRIAVRVDDLKNFKNYIKILNERDRPNSGTNEMLDARWGHSKPAPTFFGR